MSILPTDFSLAVSISDLLIRDGDGESRGNPDLLGVFETLGIGVDLPQLYRRFFAAKLGEGDVLLYRHASQGGSAFAIDLYRGLSDQLNIVALGFRVGTDVEAVRTALHAFFESATCQVHYEEGRGLKAVSAMLGEDEFPRIVELYAQECVVMQDD